MNPGGGSGWDEPPLDIHIPDDARELEREVIAYHREQRALRRRRRLRRLTGPFRGPGTIMPLLASVLAVCLVAGAMLSVATFSPATRTDHPTHHPSATQAAATAGPVRSRTARPTGSANSSAQSAAAPSTAAGTAVSSRGGTAISSGAPSDTTASATPAHIAGGP